MGIRFFCDACDRKLNVKSFLAGKRGICPHCGSRVKIPAESTRGSGEQSRSTTDPEPKAPAVTAATSTVPAARSLAAATFTSHVATPVGISAAMIAVSQTRTVQDPIDDAPEAVWYVRPPSGGQFGPADGTIMRKWISEGRVSGDSLVWREGWEDWRKAEPVFPSLAVPTPPQVAAPTPVTSNGSTITSTKVAPTAVSKTSTVLARRRKSNGMGIAVISILGLLIAALATVLIVIIANK